MAITTRAGALLTLPLTVAFLAACGGTATTGVTAEASTGSSTPSAASTPTSTPAPTQPQRTAPPRPTTSIERRPSSPGPFTGDWKGTNTNSRGEQ